MGSVDKIALALSGGGVRAAVFHLGVLKRLACSNDLEKVRTLSTVSGGSLCAGLVFARNDYHWPSSDQFLHQVEPAVHDQLTKFDLEQALKLESLLTFWDIFFQTRAKPLSRLIQRKWGIKISLKDFGKIPGNPRWMINTTCYESGKNFRFEHFRYGDYLIGYSEDTNFPLADAMAASAGFPGAIGALPFDTTKRKWFCFSDSDNTQDSKQSFARKVEDHTPSDPEHTPIDASRMMLTQEDQAQRIPVPTIPCYKTIHLWDGGVYDNQGLEGLHDFETGWSRFGFLIVSDGSGKSKEKAYRFGVSALWRAGPDIMMNQVRSLRARAVWERFNVHKETDQGVYVLIGDTCENVLATARKNELISEFKPFQDGTEATLAAATPTTLRKLQEDEYARLIRNGFEVADANLSVYHPESFQHIPYQ